MGVNRPSGYRLYAPSGSRIEKSSSYTPIAAQSAPNPNPNPNDYKIIKAHEEGAYLIVKIKYHGCTNFEGQKILVFRDVTLIDLVNQKVIDPHFFEDKEFASPIARFIPNDEGWDMAVKFVKTMEK